MTTGLVLLNFGEPSTPDRETVREYLTRIFMDNASLEAADSEAAVRERSRELAERRLPSLMEEYEAIGGSPLQEQAGAQRDAITSILTERGYDVRVVHAMQFMDPLVPDVVEQLATDGIESLIAVPMYPLSGPSTTVSAIDALHDAIDDTAGYDPEVRALAGWHRTPTYTRVKAETIADYAATEDLALQDPDTELVFSAHGTPVSYLEEGSRYDQYVEEHAAMIARLLGVDSYTIGFQNHANRGIEWTEPETEDVVVDLADEVERVIVDPLSFIHEQSETLVELDIDLQEDAEEAGVDLYRVPVPHDDDRIPRVIADRIEPFLAGGDPSYYQLRQCQCQPAESTYCLNAPRRQ